MHEHKSNPKDWRQNSNVQSLVREGEEFAESFRADVQQFFSRVQHHCHPDGKPLATGCVKYSARKRAQKDKNSVLECKHGFPKIALVNSKSSIVCPVVAKHTKQRVKGRRNQLGLVLGRRSCPMLCGTAAMLAGVYRSNTNVVTDIRLPLTCALHSRSCPCWKKLDSAAGAGMESHDAYPSKTRAFLRRMTIAMQKACSRKARYQAAYMSKGQGVAK